MVEDKAIFLHKIKYGDSGLILKMFTKNQGKTAFLIQGLKGKNKSIPAILHPLALLEVQFFDSKKSELKRVKEVQVIEPLHNIRNDLTKSGLSFFLSEVCLKCLHENESQPELHQFIQTSVQLLNHADKIGNFHLVFLVRLSQFLGFSPTGVFTGREFFDLKEGVFTRIRPVHIHYLEVDGARRLSEILGMGYEYLDEHISKGQRAQLLDKLLYYFKSHVHGFNELKTLEILKQLSA